MINILCDLCGETIVVKQHYFDHRTDSIHLRVYITTERLTATQLVIAHLCETCVRKVLTNVHPPYVNWKP